MLIAILSDIHDNIWKMRKGQSLFVALHRGSRRGNFMT